MIVPRWRFALKMGADRSGIIPCRKKPASQLPTIANVTMSSDAPETDLTDSLVTEFKLDPASSSHLYLQVRNGLARKIRSRIALGSLPFARFTSAQARFNRTRP
jgi:hypothetical protein